MKGLNKYKIKSTICLLFVLLATYTSGQDYILNVLDTTTYSTTCGKISDGYWGVKNDSCLLYTPFLTPLSGSGDSVTISFLVRLNQTGNLESNDHAYLYTQINDNGAWKLNKLFEGVDYTYVHTYNGSIKISVNDSVRLIICLENNSPTEWWQIKDGYPIVNDVSYKDGDPMPVELISFKAYIENDLVLLKWATASETNNDYFTVEKSINGVDFEELSRIDGADNSNSLTEYYFTDDFTSAKMYYRLKQTDFDGLFSYSSIIAAEKPSFNSPNIIIHSEGNIIDISAFSEICGQMQLNIYNLMGQLIFTNKVNIKEGANSFNFLPFIQSASNYIISIRINDQIPIIEKMYLN